MRMCLSVWNDGSWAARRSRRPNSAGQRPGHDPRAKRQRDRARIGMPDAAFRQRTCPAKARRQVGRWRRRRRSPHGRRHPRHRPARHLGRPAPAACRRRAQRHRPASCRRAARRQAGHCIDPRPRPCGHAGRIGHIRIAQRLPPSTQGHAPQGTRRAARAIRPGVARQRQDGARACALRRRIACRSGGCRRPARHALAVIAVARDGVDAAQFCLCLGQRRANRATMSATQPACSALAGSPRGTAAMAAPSRAT